MVFFYLAKCARPKNRGDLRSYAVQARPISIVRAICLVLMVSRKKGNQTMKFGQLIEYNMINTFLEKSYTKCDGEAIPRLFFKISKLSISLNKDV